MSADILSNPTFPHGTKAGFQSGCHGSHCPGVMTCRDVHTRYQGDYAFRKLIDAGATPEQIVDQERRTAKAAEEAAQAALAAKRSRTQVQARERANAAGKEARAARRATPRTPGEARTDLQRQVVEYHSRGLTDREIGERIGRTRDQASATRFHLGLKANPGKTTNDRIRELHAQGLDDIQIARALGKRDEYINACRRRMNLPLIRAVPIKVSSDELRKLHAEGLTDREISLRMNVDARYIGKRRRKLGLTPNTAPASAGASSFQESA